MLLFKDLFLPAAASGERRSAAPRSTLPGSVPHYGAATAARDFVPGLGNAAESDRWFGPRPTQNRRRAPQAPAGPAGRRSLRQPRAIC